VNGYSPTLSILTAALEIGLAIWAFRSPGRQDILRTTGLLLLVLAGYQVAEVFICAEPSRRFLAALAFVDIVWLPPLGLWLLVLCTGTQKQGLIRLTQSTFVMAGLLATWVLVDDSFVVGTVCQTVLATYEHGTPFHHVYGVFYELSLGAMIVGAMLGAVKLDDKIARAHCADLQLGVLAFMIPALFTQVFWKGLDPSLPSIMCHYAIILALLLGRLVARERGAGM
jgi:hypothetical protein